MPSRTPKGIFHINNYELVPFDNAVEVTSDFKISNEPNTPENQSEYNNVISSMHKSNSDQENSEIIKTVTEEDLELISHYINIDAENDVKVNEDLEVIRTKVVRRTKRSVNQNSKNNSGDINTQSNTSLENRLSKATTDSGLCLETPYSSDSELTDMNDDVGNSDEGLQTTFEIGDFCHDISVTFSTPIKNEKKQPSESEEGKSDIEERGAPEGQEDPDKNISCNSGANRLPLQPGNDGMEDKVNTNDDEDEEEEELSIYDLCKVSPASENCDKTIEDTQSTPSDPVNNDIKSISSMSSTKSLLVDVVSEELAKLALEKPEDLDMR